MAKLSDSGAIVGATAFGASARDDATAVAVRSDGRTFVAGSLEQPGVDVRFVARTAPFVVELDDRGRRVSAQHFGFARRGPTFEARRSTARGA